MKKTPQKESPLSVTVDAAPIDVGDETSRLLDGAKKVAGAAVFFAGVVRGDKASAMTLQHYPGMTERALSQIAAAAAQKFALSAARIVHRIGRLTPGETIVFVGVAAKHRAAAFDACEYITDYLKTRAPFWKKEETGDGERWVKAAKKDDDARRRWEQS